MLNQHSHNESNDNTNSVYYLQVTFITKHFINKFYFIVMFGDLLLTAH